MLPPKINEQLWLWNILKKVIQIIIQRVHFFSEVSSERFAKALIFERGGHFGHRKYPDIVIQHLTDLLERMKTPYWFSVATHWEIRENSGKTFLMKKSGKTQGNSWKTFKIWEKSEKDENILLSLRKCWNWSFQFLMLLCAIN